MAPSAPATPDPEAATSPTEEDMTSSASSFLSSLRRAFIMQLWPAPRRAFAMNRLAFGDQARAEFAMGMASAHTVRPAPVTRAASGPRTASTTRATGVTRAPASTSTSAAPPSREENGTASSSGLGLDYFDVVDERVSPPAAASASATAAASATASAPQMPSYADATRGPRD